MRIFAVLAVVAAAAAFVGSAGAVRPDKYDAPFQGHATMSGVCNFDVDVVYNQTGTEIDYFDKAGNLTRIHVAIVEQDVFSANGKSLTGLPFRFNLDLLFDSDGNLTHAYASGITSRILLPSGSLFFSAGRADFINHPDAEFLLSPDVGVKGNVAGFCAALSP
jgi:hypothetical protein